MKPIDKIRDVATGYYGIHLEEWPDGWHMYSSNGFEHVYAEKPTAEEIEEFIEAAQDACY